MDFDLDNHRFGRGTSHTFALYEWEVPRNVAGVNEKISRPLDRRIQAVVMLLEKNSHKQIPIGEMARVVNLSPGRLAHLFKSEMEFSIQQYLTQVRLAKAKSHLESSFLSIKEIAASVGFSSVARFAVCFKNLVGVTPAQYRKHHPVASYQRFGDLAVARSAKT